MADQIPFRTDAAPVSAVASRVQARLDGLDPAAAVAAPLPPGDEPVWGDERQVRLHPGDGLAAEVDRLHRSLQLLRDQLDQVFDDLEERLAETEARAGVAEARASVSEARASVAETRAADAEARADDAGRRVDELVAELQRVLVGPSEVGTRRTDLRSALDRLRDRLDVG